MTQPKNPQTTAQTVQHIKNQLTDEQRLQAWQHVCQSQHLSGEFALAARLGQEVVSEEHIHMISELFGR